MTGIRSVSRFIGVVALAAGTISCGNVVRDGRSPVILVVDSLQGASGGGHLANTFAGTLFSDVIVLLTAPTPCTPTNPCATLFSDSGQVTLRIVPKDIGTTASPAAPTTNNEVTVTRYHVNYRRADGRNTPGVDVPYPFDGGATGTVKIGGTTTISFEIVRHDAKMESPLVQLRVNPNIIGTIAEVTFYGKDLVGNDISATGQMTIEFGNFGDN